MAQRYRLAACGLLLGFVCLAADPPSVPSRWSRFLGVTIQAANPAQTMVEVTTTEPAAYHAFRLEHPRRLVLDIKHTELATGPRFYAGEGQLVERVRLGQFFDKGTPVVRVVADLRQEYGFDVRYTSHGVRETLWTAVAGLIAPVAAEQPAVLGPGSRARESGLVATASPLRVENPFAVSPGGADPSLAPLPNPLFAAVQSLARAAQTLPPELSSPRSFQAVGPSAAPASQLSLGPENCPGMPYTGDRSSFNLKDVDLKDFFRLIHELSGLNVIVDSDVSGSLTLALDSVPWDQALHLVLQNNALACTLEGNVLRVAKLQTLAAAAKAVPLVTKVRRLHYANAADVTLNPLATTALGGGVNPLPTIFGVASILKNLGEKVLGPGGYASADARDNAVVFSCIPKQVPVVEAVIDQMDRKSQQVSIEARIVLTTSDVVHQVQTALNTLIHNRSGSVTTGGVTGSGASATPVTSAPVLSSTNVSGFGAFAISNLGGLYAINAAIAAAETRNEAKTISAPTIVTQNNIPGVVSQGTQIPLQTTINNTVTTVYINATLTLGVTPLVTGDGSVFLNIVVQNNSPGPVIAGTSNPEINTQAATTQVLVPDGGVVVFGGIKVTSNTRSVNEVPGLGSIPVLGNLFKSTQREDQRNELIFIVTPRIVG